MLAGESAHDHAGEESTTVTLNQLKIQEAARPPGKDSIPGMQRGRISRLDPLLPVASWGGTESLLIPCVLGAQDKGDT